MTAPDNKRFVGKALDCDEHVTVCAPEAACSAVVGFLSY